MTAPPPPLLLVEDNHALAEALQEVLTEEGYAVTRESRGDEGARRAREEPFELVLCDIKLPGMSGLDLVRELHAARPRLPIILMTAHGTTDTAIEAMKYGAYDYLLKPFEMRELLDRLAQVMASSRRMRELVHLGPPEAGRTALVGRSRAMQQVFKDIGRLAGKGVGVLIRGETGTGKELVARAIYQHSNRAGKPFLPINCAAIPATLLESDLFGHERGAFTGATERRIGRLEQAQGGTVFLDEIGDMPPDTQAKLLRVLQDKCIRRLGGRETVTVDIRILAATHRDLEAAIARGEFREDLFYRLNVATLFLPPLRERLEDLELLVSYFLNRYGPEFGQPQPAILPEALAALRQHHWPGNVRELENVIRRALLRAQGYPIHSDHIRLVLESHDRERAPQAPDPPASLEETVADLLAAAQSGEIGDARARLLARADRELFTQAIRLARGNQAKAARWLGISRLTMHEKLEQYGIPPVGGDDEPQSR